MTTVTARNVFKGMRVSKAIGTVKDCADLHNVDIEYDNGGGGLYCLQEGCDEETGIEPLYVIEAIPKQDLLDEIDKIEDLLIVPVIGELGTIKKYIQDYNGGK